MIHLHTSNTFRLSEWPKSQASHAMFFKEPRVKFNISALLEFIAGQLNDTNVAFVRPSTFSLINVFSNISKLSYGFQGPPNAKQLESLATVSFTFAITSDNVYDRRIEPAYTRDRTPRSSIWGYTLWNNGNFLTINVPKSVMTAVNMRVPSLKELGYLYMLVGAFSKSFAKRHQFYTRSTDIYRSKSLDMLTAYSKYYTKPMLYMFKNVPYDLWVYNKEIWDRAPNIINPRSFNIDAVDYYCRFFYSERDIPNIDHYNKLAYNYIRSGVLDILSEDVHTTRYTKTVNFLIGSAHIPKNIIVEDTVKSILNKTYAYYQE